MYGESHPYPYDLEGHRPMCSIAVATRYLLALSLFIGVESVAFLINYYYCYDSVYPGSKPAAMLNKNWTAYIIFKWIAGLLTVPATFALAPVVLWPILILGESCLLLYLWGAISTWGFWVSWPMEYIWHKAVWNGACQGWNITAILQGEACINYIDTSSAFLVANATISLLRGSYTMNLALQNTSNTFDVYNLYVVDTFGYTPPLFNISYNVTNTSFSINNIVASYNMTPNLSFPSLGLELRDPSIPFSTDGYHPPAANLVLHNGTRVLNTVTLSPSDCTQLKVCGMSGETEEAFEIVLGVVMMEQFVYSVWCTNVCGTNGSLSGMPGESLSESSASGESGLVYPGSGIGGGDGEEHDSGPDDGGDVGGDDSGSESGDE